MMRVARSWGGIAGSCGSGFGVDGEGLLVFGMGGVVGMEGLMDIVDGLCFLGRRVLGKMIIGTMNMFTQPPKHSFQIY